MSPVQQTHEAPPSVARRPGAGAVGPEASTAPSPSERTAVSTQLGPEAGRFVHDIVQLNDRLTFGRLPHELAGDPLFLSGDTGDGLVTVSAAESQIPVRYLKGILGFRMTQYLRLGWIADELVFREALFHEPVGPRTTVENIHTVTLDVRTGRIVGYIGLVCSLDPTPMPLDSPFRGRFPSELAHHVDLVTRFAAPNLHSHQVFEVKRFVRSAHVDDEEQRWRVPWHLILGLGSAIVAAGESIRIILGDSKENGALRHFRSIGFEPVVVTDTSPSLPRTELMWPSYQQKVNAKPFVAPVPADFSAYMEAIRAGLTAPEGRTERALAARLSAQRRHAAHASGGAG